MELEIINKLFLELSQFATASTAKEIRLRGEIEAAYKVGYKEAEEKAAETLSGFVDNINKGHGSTLLKILKGDENARNRD